MARRVILDTGVVIGFERGTLDSRKVLAEDDAAIASVTAMELLVGVERADADHRRRRMAIVEMILAALVIEPYTLETARPHARLVAEAQRRGRPRSNNDLMIAATAVATDRILLTTDARAQFFDLPGVNVEAVP